MGVLDKWSDSKAVRNKKTQTNEMGPICWQEVHEMYAKKFRSQRNDLLRLSCYTCYSFIEIPSNMGYNFHRYKNIKICYREVRE